MVFHLVHAGAGEVAENQIFKHMKTFSSFFNNFLLALWLSWAFGHPSDAFSSS